MVQVMISAIKQNLMQFIFPGLPGCYDSVALLLNDNRCADYYSHNLMESVVLLLICILLIFALASKYKISTPYFV